MRAVIKFETTGVLKPLLIAALFFGVSGSLLAGENVSGKVVAITDGDTLIVLDQFNIQHKIRLAGVDAPEKSQPFGNRSRQNLADHVFGKSVVVEVSKLDRYKRQIGIVRYLGQDMNLAQIRDGMAWHYKQYAGEQSAQDRATYADAEVKAQQMRIGLWSEINPLPPWDFRQKKRSN